MIKILFILCLYSIACLAMEEKEVSLKQLSSTSRHACHQKRPCIVFGMDEAICWKMDGLFCHRLSEEYSRFKRYFPNATVIKCPYPTVSDLHDFSYKKGDKRSYFFAPYIEHVFDYLLRKDIQIAFFSSGLKERNTFLIDTYFKEKLGEDIYEKLKKTGQFKVFSRQHGEKKPGGMYKNLQKVGFCRDCTILVDDDPSFCHPEEKIMIKTQYKSLDGLLYDIHSWEKAFMKDKLAKEEHKQSALSFLPYNCYEPHKHEYKDLFKLVNQAFYIVSRVDRALGLFRSFDYWTLRETTEMSDENKYLNVRHVPHGVKLLKEKDPRVFKIKYFPLEEPETSPLKKWREKLDL